jgi:hypothetical protein
MHPVDEGDLAERIKIFLRRAEVEKGDLDENATRSYENAHIANTRHRSGN